MMESNIDTISKDKLPDEELSAKFREGIRLEDGENDEKQRDCSENFNNKNTKDDEEGDKDDRENDDSDQEASLNILDLPPEMILRIFIHIDIRTIFKTVILACKTFHRILTTEGIWKSIFSLKWENMKIAKDYQYVNDWKDVYFAYDDVHSIWKRKDKYTLKSKKKMDGHLASVDAVHVMPGGRFAVSGSRDRFATVWDMQDFVASDDATGEINEGVVLSGHQGWVWSVTSNPARSNEVITGSWDQKVKIWDLNKNGENIETYKYHPAAILDVVCYKGLLFTGCYDKKIRIFDPRSNDKQELSYHKGAVLSLIFDDNMIISNSEDKTIGICDRRMLSMQVQKINVENRVLCLNTGHEQGFNYLRAGGTNGTLGIFDTTNQIFTQLDSIQLWDTLKVLKIANFQGALIACAPTGYFKAYTPDRAMKLLGTYHEHSHDISSIHARNNVMVTGSCDDTVAFWKFCNV